MSTYTISIPGHFVQDWNGSSMSYAENIAKGNQTAAVAAAYTELYQALTDTPPRKHGRGTRYVVELSRPTVEFLQAEAKYRYEFNAPMRSNTYGVVDPDPVARYAASRIMKACQRALKS